MSKAVDFLRRAEAIEFISFYAGGKKDQYTAPIHCRMMDTPIGEIDAKIIVRRLNEAIAPVKYKWAATFRKAAIEDLGAIPPDFPPDETPEAEIQRLQNIVRMMIRNAKRIPETFDVQGDPGPFNGLLWHRVSQLAGVGRTTAAALCREFGEDPDWEPERATSL